MNGLQLPKSKGEPFLCIEWVDASGDPDAGGTFRAEYCLYIPLKQGDIRNEDGGGWQRVFISYTTRDGGSPTRWGRVDTPYRDGTHMLWDSGRMRLTGYAVCADFVTTACANGLWFEEGRAPMVRCQPKESDLAATGSDQL